MNLPNISTFIADSVTQRPESLFRVDVLDNHSRLQHAIGGKSVLVIGGAGTIGSSFVKSVLEFHPARLVVVDLSENELTELVRDLRSMSGIVIPKEFQTYPIDFGSDIFEKFLREEGPFEIVANFAAHKHVRSEKDPYSIAAMIDNNVFKAQRLLDLLTEITPQHFFCVSTDKAANPVNVMGASKKLMEEVILSYSKDIRICTARFANVAFSNGSLLYGYLNRLMKRQPLSCPSDVKRYFVSPQESGQICMLACLLGESGDIFFPKLRTDQLEYFKNITDDFIRRLGYDVHECSSEEEARKLALEWTPASSIYPVYYFKTDTSGEKLFEEFYTAFDTIDLEKYKSLGVIKNAPKKTKTDVQVMIRELRETLNREQIRKNEIIQLIQSFIPNFNHIETGKNLDQKM